MQRMPDMAKEDRPRQLLIPVLALNDGTHIAVNFSPLKKQHAVCVTMQTAYVFDGAR